MNQSSNDDENSQQVSSQIQSGKGTTKGFMGGKKMIVAGCLVVLAISLSSGAILHRKGRDNGLTLEERDEALHKWQDVYDGKATIKEDDSGVGVCWFNGRNQLPSGISGINETHFKIGDSWHQHYQAMRCELATPVSGKEDGGSRKLDDWSSLGSYYTDTTASDDWNTDSTASCSTIPEDCRFYCVSSTTEPIRFIAARKNQRNEQYTYRSWRYNYVQSGPHFAGYGDYMSCICRYTTWSESTDYNCEVSSSLGGRSGVSGHIDYDEELWKESSRMCRQTKKVCRDEPPKLPERHDDICDFGGEFRFCSDFLH